MEIVASVVTGTLLLLVGGHIGFALGRAYEKRNAIQYVAYITSLVAKKVGMSEKDMTNLLDAAGKEIH